MGVFQVQMEDTGIRVLEANKKCYREKDICEVVQQPSYGSVLISIEEMLKQLTPFNKESSIYRVPKELCEMNHKAYAPQLMSIGPFHYQNKDLIDAERYKLLSLDNFQHRLNKEKPLEFLIKTAQSWVDEARTYYAEPIKINNDEFLKMMLVDGCFIVEFIIVQSQKSKEFSLLYNEITPTIYVELIKLENQFPLFVLQGLLDLIPKQGYKTSLSILELLTSVPIYGFLSYYKLPDPLPRKPKHLIDVLSMYFLPMHLLWKRNDEKSSEKNTRKKNNFLSFFYFPMRLFRLEHDKKSSKENSCGKNNLLSYFCVPLLALWKKRHHKSRGRSLPPSISELCESGVIVRKAENPKCITNICFNNGVLEIPQLHIDDAFEPILRNLLAFEHFSTETKNILHYIVFMDYLISTEKDVRLLVKARIIINDIGGSDKEISEIFNNICKCAILLGYSPELDNISKDLLKYSNGWWNRSKASLKHNYFNTPWAFISFLAATLLIVLTILQTIFSAIATFPPR